MLMRSADPRYSLKIASRSWSSPPSYRHASYEALVADPDVDVVYVATPHPMHHGGALLALHAGKPVLVEKPLTMNAAEAEELVAFAVLAGAGLEKAPNEDRTIAVGEFSEAAARFVCGHQFILSVGGSKGVGAKNLRWRSVFCRHLQIITVKRRVCGAVAS